MIKHKFLTLTAVIVTLGCAQHAVAQLPPTTIPQTPPTAQYANPSQGVDPYESERYTMTTSRKDGSWRESQFLGEYAKRSLDYAYSLAVKDPLNMLIKVRQDLRTGSVVVYDFDRSLSSTPTRKEPKS